MWKANKKGIMVLAGGLALLALAHHLITPHHEQLADQVLALGFCALLFCVGLASWLSVKTPEAPAEEAETDEGKDSRAE